MTRSLDDDGPSDHDPIERESERGRESESASENVVYDCDRDCDHLHGGDAHHSALNHKVQQCILHIYRYKSSSLILFLGIITLDQLNQQSYAIF